MRPFLYHVVSAGYSLPALELSVLVVAKGRLELRGRSPREKALNLLPGESYHPEHVLGHGLERNVVRRFFKGRDFDVRWGLGLGSTTLGLVPERHGSVLEGGILRADLASLFPRARLPLVRPIVEVAFRELADGLALVVPERDHGVGA